MTNRLIGQIQSQWAIQMPTQTQTETKTPVRIGRDRGPAQHRTNIATTLCLIAAKGRPSQVAKNIRDARTCLVRDDSNNRGGITIRIDHGNRDRLRSTTALIVTNRKGH